jgi:hypothetical protein
MVATESASLASFFGPATRNNMLLDLRGAYHKH